MITIQHEALTIGEIVVPDYKAGVGLCAGVVAASFDSVRVTAIRLHQAVNQSSGGGKCVVDNGPALMNGVWRTETK